MRYWLAVNSSTKHANWACLHRRDRPMNIHDNLIPPHYKKILNLTTQYINKLVDDKHKSTKSTYNLIRDDIEKTTGIPQQVIWYDIIRRFSGNTLR